MTPERFMTRVVKQADGCWIWTGAIDKPSGYGKLVEDGTGKLWRAHRYSYIVCAGNRTSNRNLHHICGNRLCVRPDHLQDVSQSEHAAVHAGKSFCKNGHEMTPENTYTYRGSRPHQVCRTCRAAAQRRYNLRNSTGKAV